MQKFNLYNQNVFVVETDGRNEPSDLPAPFAGFVPNKEDADALKALQQTWGLDAHVTEMRGDVEIDVAEDGSLDVTMKLRPVK